MAIDIFLRLMRPSSSIARNSKKKFGEDRAIATLVIPFKKPPARKSFAHLSNAHPLKAIISFKSSPLLVVFQPLEVLKSLKVRQKRGAWQGCR